VSSSQLNIRKWFSGSESFLLNNTNVLRQIAGQPQSLPLADPSRVFTDSEKTFATYGLANYRTDMGGMPFDGVIGVRFTDNHDSLGGYQRQRLWFLR